MDAKLLSYFAAMDEDRRQRVLTAYRSMTNRERNIFREAAIHGYVLGAMDHGPLHPVIPPDSEVMQRVVLGCESMSDIYPVIAAATAGVRKRKGRWNA